MALEIAGGSDPFCQRMPGNVLTQTQDIYRIKTRQNFALPQSVQLGILVATFPQLQMRTLTGRARPGCPIANDLPYDIPAALACTFAEPFVTRDPAEFHEPRF